MIDEPAYSRLCGWRGVDAVQRTFAGQFPSLARTAPHLMSAAPPSPPPPPPVLLYKAWRDVLGKDPAYPAQQIGDCVSFGHGHANDLLQCIEIGLGAPAVYQETDTEFIYATSREVAGILGRQDGSYGAAAVKAMTTVGMVSRSMLGTDGAYSGDRAKDWGWHGAPASVRKEAATFPLGSAAQVSTWDELVAALSNGYPVTVCTSRGFSLKRDDDGFCALKGRWGHCMFVAAARFDRPGACIVQSWGPDCPTGPMALGQPSFSFWADRPAIEGILGEGDSWALSKAPAFEKRELPPAWKYHDAA